MNAERWSRRSFLTPRGLESATGGIPSLLLGWNAAPSSLTPQLQKHLCVSRRAMACDFSVLFPDGVAGGIEAGSAALDEIERLEAKLSAYRPDSDICLINRNAFEAPVTADHEVFELLQHARRLSEETGGAFDVAGGALTKAWGFFDGERRVPDEERLHAALEASGSKHVELDAERCSVRFRRSHVEINLGAIGKGYAIDRAIRLIRAEHGVRCALMHGGQSSLLAAGAPPGEPEGWRVAIGDPYDPKRGPIATVRLKNRAMGTSGAAFQYFEENGRRYGHVLDPRTGWPADEVASATVLAPSAADADALSTAFFVAGADFARSYCRRHPDLAAVVVTRPNGGARPEVMLLGFKPGEVEFPARDAGKV